MTYTAEEKRALEMSRKGEHLHGAALDILFDLALREMEEAERKKQKEA